MKTLKLLLLPLLLLAALNAQAQLKFYPQAGVNFAFVTNEFSQMTFSASAGFQVGLNVAIGKRLYFQPGLFWQRYLIESTLVAAGDTDDMRTDYVHLPLLVGFKIFQKDAFNIRGNAGPSLSILTGIGDNTIGLLRDFYKDLIWGLEVGAGINIFFLTLDISYEFGLTNIFEFQQASELISSKADVLKISLGFHF